MRILVDIPDYQIKDLKIISKAERISRAEAIRRAITLYIEKKNLEHVAFGLWKSHKVDGLEYQKRIRSDVY